MKSNKVSIVNTSTPVRKPKVSQFCVQHKWFTFHTSYLLLYSVSIWNAWDSKANVWVEY